MNKKVLLLIGVIVFFIIFIVFIALQQNQNQGLPATSSQNQNTTDNQNNPTTAVTLPPLSGSAQEAARQFYTYYFSTEQNPLAAGKYKTNPYLTDDFKYDIETGYDNGNIPIFCPQNKQANITVGKEVEVYLENQYMKLETISEASPGTKDLYKILLANNNGQWLVEDVHCL